MIKQLSIIAYDLKNTRRDPTLLLVLMVPLLMLAVVRFGLPLLVDYIPGLKSYYFIAISFFVLLNALFPGFVLSFILLDEKDLMLLPVLKVTPVSLPGILISRIVFMLVFGFIGSICLLLFNGIIYFTWLKAVAIAILCAMNVPLLVLLISTIAKNKVEGMTLLKLTNITLIVPVVIFFIDTSWQHLFAVFPAYWVFQFVDDAFNSRLVFLLGIVVLSGYNYLAYKFALKNITK